MTLSRFRSPLALTLVAATLLAFAVPPLRAETSARLAGRVLEADGITPASGLVVTLVDDRGEALRSAPTDAEGTFRLDVAPAGYTLVVETARGAFLAAERLTLKPGVNPPLALGLRANPSTGGLAQMSGAGGLPKWARWVIVGAITVAALLIIDEVTDDEEEPASVF